MKRSTVFRMVVLLTLSALVIFAMGCDREIDDPCQFEVGDTIDFVVYQTGTLGDSIELKLVECDYSVVLVFDYDRTDRWLNPQKYSRKAGDVVVVKVTRKNHSLSYNVKVLR